MFSHVMLGADDIDASKQFYDAVIGALGGKPGMVDPKGRVVYMHGGSIFLLTKPIDGQPLNSLFEDNNQPTLHSALRYVGEWDPIWAIRTGDWKLVKHRELLFLSDMSRDVTETDNLAAKYPEKVKELMKLYEDMKK